MLPQFNLSHFSSNILKCKCFSPAQPKLFCFHYPPIFCTYHFLDFRFCYFLLQLNFFPNTGQCCTMECLMWSLGQRETENINQMITLTKQAFIIVECKKCSIGLWIISIDWSLRMRDSYTNPSETKQFE
jgi:hypothetical protein